MKSGLAFIMGAEVLLLALPWLNPLTFGPAHAVLQWAAVWFGASLCWMLTDISVQDRQSKIRSVAVSWAMAASLSAVIGLLQYLGLSQHFSPFVNYLEAGQAFANLRQRNQLATLLAIGLCALLWIRSEFASYPVADKRLQTIAWGGAGILLSAADAASGSRTGLMQLLLLLLLGFVWKKHRIALSSFLMVYLLAAIALPQLVGLGVMDSGILGRIGELTPPCASRLTLWSNVLQLIAQKPWSGWGWGELDYAHFITLYPGPRFCDILGNAHNLPLHLAVELGVPMAVTTCGATGWLILRARPWQEQDTTRQLAWSVLAVIGLHSLLEYPLWYGPFQLAAVLALWMLIGHKKTLEGGRSSKPTPRHRVVAICTLLVCCYVAWDYWRISQIYLPLSQRAWMYREDTLEKTSDTWLFQDQVKFAALGITSITAENADQMHSLATEMLHFSPEASVVQKLIESAKALGNSAEVQYYEERYRVAYPVDYAAWRKTQD